MKIRPHARGRPVRLSPWRLAGALTLLLVVPSLAAQARKPPASRQAGSRPTLVARSRPGVTGDFFDLRIRPLLAANCFKCHGDSPRMSNLDLRSRETLLKGGVHGPAIVPGKAAVSRLYRRVAGLEQPRMPPTGKLPTKEIAAIRDWIDGGAPWSETGWWAAKPVTRPAVPALKDPWIRNPVDAFILEALRAEGLGPAPPASRQALIRRATLDLHGLPVTPEEVEAFLADTAPDAYEKVIDRLLASPRYGERWARHWLDLARYAESEGFKSDETRPNAWRYRDYVIRSLNEDKPYDRFVKEQIAGDELFPGDPDALVATGFNRHWADESNARNIRLRRQEILNDITDTVGSVLLGATVGCARCHDHKYDPIPQKDYYRLQAFFAAAQPRDDLLLVSGAELDRHRQQLAGWEEKTRVVREELARLETPYRIRLEKDHRDKFPAEVQEALAADPKQRTALQALLAAKAAPQVVVTTEELGKAMKGDERKRWEELRGQLDAFKPLKPADLPLGIGITDVGRDAPPTFTLAVGVYDAPKEPVEPGFLSAIDPRRVRIPSPANLASTGRRAALASWIASPRNPLTARVMMNRIWQHHFGRGIVPTESDFGNAGEPPTHPELLDWLAWHFVRTADSGPSTIALISRADRPSSIVQRPASRMGWSLKAMHRLVMTSATYRQASAAGPTSVGAPTAARAAQRVDPENRLLWRMPRRRLEGEAIRDCILAVSGSLNLKMGGPSIFPELPEGVSTRGGWPVTEDARERNRRSIYIFVRRNLRYPLFQAFDMPDTHEPCARRSVTTNAPQALMLLNNETVLRQAQAFAGRILRESGAAPETRIERAYRLAFGRAPAAAELQLAAGFLERQTSLLREAEARAEPLLLPQGFEGSGRAEAAAWVDFCHALFNANEFLYFD